MRTVGVRELKNNPRRALSEAHRGPVLVTNRDEPEALLVSLGTVLDADPDVRVLLAVALFDDGAASLGRAVRLSGLSTEHFIERLGERGIPVWRMAPEELEAELDLLRSWQTTERSSSTHPG